MGNSGTDTVGAVHDGMGSHMDMSNSSSCSSMAMGGFGDPTQTCFLFLFNEWKMDTDAKLLAGVLGIFILVGGLRTHLSGCFVFVFSPSLSLSLLFSCSLSSLSFPLSFCLFCFCFLSFSVFLSLSLSLSSLLFSCSLSPSLFLSLAFSLSRRGCYSHPLVHMRVGGCPAAVH